MKRLTIHLNWVEKNRSGIQNTLSFIVSDDDESTSEVSGAREECC